MIVERQPLTGFIALWAIHNAHYGNSFPSSAPNAAGNELTERKQRGCGHDD